MRRRSFMALLATAASVVTAFVIAATLPAGASAPTVFGQPMTFVAAGNRYGLPDFYKRHVWLYDSNPLGIYSDWNPDVTCRGTGDDGG